MKVFDVIQGSPAWLALRAGYRCASEAPVMMAASSRTKRSELVRMKATGDEKDYSDWVQKNLLDKGHEVEALARTLLEADIGEDLYPTVGVSDDDTMLASLDGFTMDEATIFEHKMWSRALAAAIESGLTEFPNGEEWQLEHQLLVSGAERVLFVCSDGTRERRVMMEYRPIPGRAQKLVAGWKQFDEDVAGYQHVEVLPPATGKAIAELPALTVELVGEVRSSNLPAFRQGALAFIASINTDLQTDQHFADAEKAVKFCDDAEKRIALVKQQALSQTASIDELFRTMDDISEGLRQKRLTLDKLVTTRKATIREDIRREGVEAFITHVRGLNHRIGKPYMPVVAVDFPGVMKGKKTILSLRDAVATELARVKIEANEIADRIQVNLTTLSTLAAGYETLFPDEGSIVLKATDDLTPLIKTRIADHTAKEQAKKAAVAPAAPAAQQAPAPESALAPPVAPAGNAKRPTDDQIIAMLAAYYKAPEARVIGWLLTMKLAEAAEKRKQPQAA